MSSDTGERPDLERAYQEGKRDGISGPPEHESEMWTLKKDTFYAAIQAVQNGLDYARDCLITHDTNLGRTIRKNKIWAERMEEDIKQMENTLSALRAMQQ